MWGEFCDIYSPSAEEKMKLIYLLGSVLNQG